MGELFGTDGIRGLAVPSRVRDDSAISRLIEQREFSPGLLQLVGEALGTWLRPSGEARSQVVIGWDSRPLNDELVGSLTLGLHLSGCNVIWVGECATPGLHGCVLQTGSAAGCMVTASHNPVSDSGIKIFDSDGYKTFPDTELELEELIHQLASEEREVEDDEREVLTMPDFKVDGVFIHKVALEAKIESLKERYLGDADLIGLIPDEGLLLDSSHGVARHWLAEWLSEKLALSIEMSNDCHALNDGCGAGEISPTLQMTWEDLTSVEHGHVLFDELAGKYGSSNWSAGMILAAALDGDGDRCLCIMVNEGNTGIKVVDGDSMLDMLVNAANLNCDSLQGKIAASIESDLALLNSMKQLDANLQLIETAVGDRWLASALKPEPDELGNLLCGDVEPFHIGGEDSGHLLLTTPHPNIPQHWALVGDGIVTLIATLCAAGRMRNFDSFDAGWKSRQSISPSIRSRWDGKNENAEAVITLVNDEFPDAGWTQETIAGESNLLMMKGMIGKSICAVAIRNSGTQAKTSISIRTTGTSMDGLMDSLLEMLTPRLNQ
ncbi:MAG: hypothetical protein QF707_05900 [Candidatus Poseidoniaceae archaeon]|jgi:phosphoglucosamine mutase|nr:hypothetical protein [Candidatus Poseidoniaceae archaeon]MDP7202857.1 hypothetical protein [Candidatus Poseidoniaceae archaeon]